MSRRLDDDREEVKAVRVMVKYRYVYGQKLKECECGVWCIDEYLLPCWNHEDGNQLIVEAIAQLAKAVRNLGYEILTALHLIRRIKNDH